MKAVQSSMTIRFHSVLYLTDFSKASEAAFPFAAAVSRTYGAKICALHVLSSAGIDQDLGALAAVPIEQKEKAEVEVRRLKSFLADLDFEAIVERGLGVWPVVERVIRERQIDLLVVGTHGRTGGEKLVLGSVAEEIFWRSRVPVLTIGLSGGGAADEGGRFRRILFATDFTPDAEAAVPYAISLAKEHEARLILMHAMAQAEPTKENRSLGPSVAEVMHSLYETVPKGADIPFSPEVDVEFGEASKQIVKAAKERNAHLIVLGMRSAQGHLQAPTHSGRGVAHMVAADGACPVLTVRAQNHSFF